MCGGGVVGSRLVVVYGGDDVTIAVASAVQLGSSIKSVIVLDLNRNSMRTALQ